MEEAGWDRLELTLWTRRGPRTGRVRYGPPIRVSIPSPPPIPDCHHVLGWAVRPPRDSPGSIIPDLRLRPTGPLSHRYTLSPGFARTHQTYSLLNGDLLFTRYNGSLDLLGICGMVRRLEKMTVFYPDKLIRARLSQRVVLPQYVEIFFGVPSARKQMTASAKSSAGELGVSGADTKGQPMAIPSVGNCVR